MRHIQLFVQALLVYGLIYSVTGRREPSQAAIVEDHKTVCDKRTCYQVEINETEIVSTYPGMFYTREEYARRYQLPCKQRNPSCFFRSTKSSQRLPRATTTNCENGCVNGGKYDGDHCCGTCRYFEKAPTFIYPEGQFCWVLQCPSLEKYQHTPIGECSTTGHSCDGKCKEETQMHQVVCWSPWSPHFRIVPFERNSYCSCKS